METPSSTRRVTRSQTRSAIKNSATNHLLSSKKREESDECETKTRQRKGGKAEKERSALLDISNESPIVGVAMQMGKRNMSRIKRTPGSGSGSGSGEALLRGQVKSLLQKVEEEADLTKISLESRPLMHLVTSPMGLLAPTPANTPQVVDFSQIVIMPPVVAGQLGGSSQVESEESLSITRSLLLEFSGKSELWESSECSSVVTQNLEEDDNSSVWSMQVNASSRDEEEDDDDDEDQVYSYREEDDEAEDVDVLCEGMRKMRFAGKHTRFVYDSEEEEIVEAKEQTPPLNGFSTPNGKHVRVTGDE